MMMSENKVTVDLNALTQADKNTILSILSKVTLATFIPTEGQKYWYISSRGKVDSEIYSGFYDENCKIASANCYETKKEATFALEEHKVIYALRKYAKDHNTCEINWEDKTQPKYCLSYRHDKTVNDIITDTEYSCETACVYFSSAHIALEAVNAVGEDRIKKYLFKI